MRPINKESGGALLTALFIMTLVAIVATAMSTRLQQDIYRTQALTQYDSLYLASQAVTFWSLNALTLPGNRFTQLNKEGMVADFPKQATFIHKQIRLSGGIYDLQARFNLNNLLDKKYLLPLTNLLDAIYPKAMQQERIRLGLIIKNWIMPYDLGQGKDEYTAFYQGQNPPYNPSHQLLSSLSELRLMNNVSGPLYLILEPFLTVLPETTTININTASKPVLMTLGNGLSENKVNGLLALRAEKGIRGPKNFNKLITELNLPPEQVTIESSFFLGIAIAQNNELTLRVYTLFKRSKNKKGIVSVQILRESINTFS